MERHPLNIPNYFKVHVSFLQEQELLVAGETAETVEAMVRENVLPSTEQFQIISITPLSDEEKDHLVQSMMRFEEEDNDPSGEVQDTRTLN